MLKLATVVLIYLQLLQSKNSCNSQTLHSETKTQAEFGISVTGAERTSLQPKENIARQSEVKLCTTLYHIP